ncbi:MAG: efflux transporter outer membrane subunit [Deltaproteobacteria bacterium]|nr:efflux transporter outer membrane subunit [Deltaproteobacteria bacterium]
MRWFLRAVLAALAVCPFLTGCAVGPDFRPPAPPDAGAYTATELPTTTAGSPAAGGAPQRFVPGQDIPEAWWRLFRSEPLDALIRRAMADSPTVALAQARIREARENRRAQFGTLYPRLDAGLGASRQRISGASLGQPDTGGQSLTLLNASLDVSYSPDLFGGTRHQLEALDMQIAYQRFQLEGAYLTLTASIVTTAVKEASLVSQIRAVREIVAVQAKELEMLERRLQIGGVARTDVLSQRTQLAQAEATLPPLELELEQTRHQLAVLVGQLPSEAALLEFELDQMSLPEEIPVSVPSSLVRQRPDIGAAEALLHFASARVGVATANLYPQVTLTGSLGVLATTPGDLFSDASTVWRLGAGLLQPLFRGGTLKAQQSAAVALYDQSLAQYRQTVLESFRNVADVLRALESDARSLKASAQAEAIARDTLEVVRRQHEVGAVSYLFLLNAERGYREARIGTIRARAARLADTAALFQALGGGWWNRPGQDLLPSRQAEASGG